MRGLWQDFAFGARTYHKTPAATAAVVATLAFGIATTAVAFALLNSFFIRPLPVREPERLVRIYTSYAGGPQYFTVSYADFADMRELRGVFSGALVEEPLPISVGLAGAQARVWGLRASDGYFSLLGVRPAHGRFFASEDHRASAGQPVVVLGHGLWQREFGGNRGVLGETLTLNGRPFTIVGVAPKGFQGTSLGLFPDLWLPVAAESDARNNRGARGYFALARLAPGASVAEARAALDVLARRLEQAYPASNRGIRFATLPEREGRLHPMVRGGFLGFSGALLAVASLLLLLACANVAAVLLARAFSRRKEIGVRLALGATRGRILRQLLAEGAVLCLPAGGIGLSLAWAMTRVLGAVPLPTARGAALAFDLGLDARVLGFSLLVTVLTGLAFGLAPALEASRSDLVAVMRGGAAPGASPSRLRHALVAGQVALCTVLLIGAGLFLRSLQNARRLDLGFDPAGVVVASLDLTPRDYGPAQATQLWRRLVERVSALPRTQSVSLADRVPFEVNVTTISVAAEGAPPPAGGWPSIEFATVDAAYFATLRIPLLEGRDFGERDAEASPPVVIVNEVLARQLWRGERVVGRRVVLGGRRAHEVIGVARRAKHLTLGEEAKPHVYLPLSHSDVRTLTLVARARGDPQSFLQELRETVRAIDDTVPLYNVSTLSRYVDWAFLPATSGATALNVVGLVGLLLTSLGLYGTVAYTTSRRTHEIGVRRALGARNGDVVWLVVRQSLLLVGLGLAGGLPLGYAVSRLVGGLLYGVDAADPAVFGLAPAVLLLVSVVASSAPAHRATRIDPASALRHE